MKKSSLIGHTVELFQSIRMSERPADFILTDFYKARRYLGSRDRRFISEHVFAMIRHYRLLGEYVNATLDIMGVEGNHSSPNPILMFGALEVKLLGLDSGALKESLGGIGEAYLREIDTGKFLETLERVVLPDVQKSDPATHLSIRHSMPDLICREWVVRYGLEEAGRLCSSMNEQAPVTIRVNTLKASLNDCRAKLKEEGVETEPGKLSPHSLILQNRINAQAHQSFKEGMFEMQDEGSQLVSFLLNPEPGTCVVDACAGSGGKSLHLASIMQNRGRVIAIDVEKGRLNNLGGRARRAGVTIIESLLADSDESLKPLEQSADYVLIDAPCSGVGTFRRNPGLKMSYSVEYLLNINKTQPGILDAYARLLKPGGRLVYATCSLLRQENEDVVNEFLSRTPAFELIDATSALREHGIVIESNSSFLTLLPHRNSTDGFFAALMQRRNEADWQSST